MKVLVIGSGGREHALAWKIAQSTRVSEVIVAPGNAGTATEGKCRNVDVAVKDIDGLLALARREEVALTVVGPEIPLVLGVVVGAVVGIVLIVLARRGRDIPIPFGPYLAAAGLLAMFWGEELTQAYLRLL